MSSTGETYNDLGPDYHRTRNPELTKRRAIAQLQAMGLTVTLTPDPDAQAS